VISKSPTGRFFGSVLIMKSLIEKITNLPRKQSTLLIGIDGLGGSGKSTVTKLIKEGMPNTAIIEMDDFYVPELQIADWDRVFEQVIKPLKNNAAVSYQRFDWDSNKLAEWHAVEPGGIVVIEGVYSLHEKLRANYDYKIWVECPYEARLQ